MICQQQQRHLRVSRKTALCSQANSGTREVISKVSIQMFQILTKFAEIPLLLVCTFPAWCVKRFCDSQVLRLLYAQIENASKTCG